MPCASPVELYVDIEGLFGLMYTHVIVLVLPFACYIISNFTDIAYQNTFQCSGSYYKLCA